MRVVVLHNDRCGCTQWERLLYTLEEVVVQSESGGSTQ